MVNSRNNTTHSMYEIKLMKYIQKLNFSKQMQLISSPFNASGYIVLIIILYICKILDMKDVIIIIITSIIGVGLKFIFKRVRPYMSDNVILNYSGKEHNDIMDIYSFPSGHTLTATILCLTMLNKYPKEFIFNIIAVLVGFSRISLGVHYPTDIIGGAIFGFLLYSLLV